MKNLYSYPYILIDKRDILFLDGRLTDLPKEYKKEANIKSKSGIQMGKLTLLHHCHQACLLCPVLWFTGRSRSYNTSVWKY